VKQLLLLITCLLLSTAVLANPATAQDEAAAPAPAAADGGGEGDEQQPAPVGGGSFLMPMLIIFALFYFIMLRPGQSKEKQRTKRVNIIEKHNQVITRGGIIGKVVSVNEDRQELTIVTDESTDTRLVLSRSGVWDLYEPPEPTEQRR